MILNIDNELYERAKQQVLKNRVEYPTIKNFVDKALRKFLEDSEDGNRKTSS